jgi:alkylated DNA repair dioxygenase AlkB
MTPMVAVAALQTTLFAQGQPGLRRDVRVERTALDEHSWLDLARNWLGGADRLLADLAESLTWKCGRRPMYGSLVDDPRLSAAIDLEAADTAGVVRDMAHWLDDRYLEAIDSVWVNYYRDGRDSVAWHSDRVGRTQVNPIVAIVSLGGPRRFLLRPMEGSTAVRLVLGSGDLLVMGGACQHGWEHTIPKMAGAPPRMSVTLRRREGLLDPAEDWWPDAGPQLR